MSTTTTKGVLAGFIEGFRAVSGLTPAPWPADLPCRHTRFLPGCQHCALHRESQDPAVQQ